MLTMAPTAIMIVGDIDAGCTRDRRHEWLLPRMAPAIRGGLLSELEPGVTRRRGYERNEEFRDGGVCPI